MYDIMGYEGALYDSPSGAILVLVECVVELCDAGPCVLSITLMGSDIGGTPMMICTCHYSMDGLH